MHVVFRKITLPCKSAKTLTLTKTFNAHVNRHLGHTKHMSAPHSVRDFNLVGKQDMR